MHDGESLTLSSQKSERASSLLDASYIAFFDAVKRTIMSKNDVPVKKKRKRGRPSLQKQIDFTKVLEVATDIFSNKGFEGARVSEIAEKAGYTKSLMNYHFGNKELLWKRSVSLLRDKLINRFLEIQGYFKDLKGIDAIKAYVRQFIYFSAEHPEFYKLVFHEMCTKTERADWLIENILKPIHVIPEKNSSLNEKGEVEIEGYPLPNFESLMIGCANVFFIHAYQMEKMYGKDPFKKEEIEKHADIVIELLFAKFDKN